MIDVLQFASVCGVFILSAAGLQGARDGRYTPRQLTLFVAGTLACMGLCVGLEQF